MKKYDELGPKKPAKLTNKNKQKTKEEYTYPGICHRTVSYVFSYSDIHTLEISGKTLLILF